MTPLLKVWHWPLTALRTESHSSPLGLFFLIPPHPRPPPAPLVCCSHRRLLTVLTCKLLPAPVSLLCNSLYLNIDYLVASLSILRSQFKSLPSSGKSLLTALCKAGSPHHNLLLSFRHSGVKKTEQNLKSYWLYSTVHESGSIKSSR